jgi:hypothetical protein
VQFEDGTFSYAPMHHGSLESCQFVAVTTSAITCSSPQKVKEASLRVISDEEWKELEELARNER